MLLLLINIICTKNLHLIVCLQWLEVFVAFLYSLSIFMYYVNFLHNLYAVISYATCEYSFDKFLWGQRLSITVNIFRKEYLCKKKVSTLIHDKRVMSRLLGTYYLHAIHDHQSKIKFVLKEDLRVDNWDGGEEVVVVVLSTAAIFDLCPYYPQTKSEGYTFGVVRASVRLFRPSVHPSTLFVCREPYLSTYWSDLIHSWYKW